MSRPLSLWVHAFVAGVVMLGGLLLLGLGLLLQIRDPFQNVKLQYVEGSAINKFLSVAFIAIIAGGILVVASVLGVCAAKATASGGISRILVVSVYTIVLIVILVALIFIASVVLLLTKGKSPLGLEGILEQAWMNTVATERNDACRLQSDFECFGFHDNFCVGCGKFNSSGLRDCSAEQAPYCPICPDTLPTTTTGCYGAIVNATKGYYTPIGISSAVVAGVLLFDGVVVCAL